MIARNLNSLLYLYHQSMINNRKLILPDLFTSRGKGLKEIQVWLKRHYMKNVKIIVLAKILYIA